ncbi:hypothetical protein J2794_004377 [Paraburkholderia terricola]|jgi:hypothetical protein|uniref:CesT family type III secretion system chaperone n=1 Tax=Paraburkholderia terricola TaxID=169427 RepID=UPI0009F67763|nr:CesT family type III secretion system chaperone [Paraburkholderia terricola]MDR6448247.1 hypothetical protein [Paraburkholderia terricola]ORC46104.1 hypothetical protein B2G74_27400 [Burkholderia sp. A27]
MSHAHYTALIGDICKSAGLGDPARLIESGQLAVSGHVVSLRYDERTDPLHVRVQVELGELQAAEREEVYRLALEANLHAATAWDGAVGLDPESERLHYVLFFPLDGSRGAADLLGTIAELLDEREDEVVESGPRR